MATHWFRLPRIGFLLVLLLAALPKAGWAQPATWQRVALDSVASVAFPDSVSRQQVKGRELLVCRTGPAICMALTQPTTSFAGLLSGSSREFNDGLVRGLLKGAGGKLLRRKNFQVGHFTGVEVEYTTPAKPELPATKYTRLLLVYNTVYTLNYWTDAGPDAAAEAERRRFFASFHLNAQAAEKQSGAYKLGKVVGGLAVLSIAAAVLIGLAVALVLILRRRQSS